MSIFERFRIKNKEEWEMTEERRQEAMRRAQDELKERLKKQEGQEKSETREKMNDLTQEASK